jgi:hypothetical protein
MAGSSAMSTLLIVGILAGVGFALVALLLVALHHTEYT